MYASKSVQLLRGASIIAGWANIEDDEHGESVHHCVWACTSFQAAKTYDAGEEVLVLIKAKATHSLQQSACKRARKEDGCLELLGMEGLCSSFACFSSHAAWWDL
eukprot:6456459-Amphidinium_carterae.1